jgi:uncharacterized protein YkwD/uncharacterized protein YukE
MTFINPTKLLGFAAGMLLVAGGFWYLSYSGNAAPLYRQLVETFTETKQVATEIVENAETPAPLQGSREQRAAYQTVAGVIAETNKHRATEGLEPFTMNAQLNASANVKLDDLFARQYFAHSAPTGEGPSDLITAQEYEYITVAENLALGNYENDRVLVQAWMDSPGHRANIMNGSFEEIGVAVGQGMYEGSRVWIAVQHFGRPTSACPAVSESLKNSIDTRQAYLDDLAEEIAEQEEELDNLKGSNPTLYNQKVDEYNSAVETYNTVAQRLKENLATYNAQVEAFNECVNPTI